MKDFIKRIFGKKQEEKISVVIDEKELIQNLGYIKNIKEILSLKLLNNQNNDVLVKIQVLVDEKIKLYELENIKTDLKEELKEQNINHSIIEFITDKSKGIKCKINME